MQQVVPLFKALADESRIRIIATIAAEGRSVEEIAALVGLSPATVSHHLARLRRVGLVEATTQSYYTIYRFAQQPLFEALQLLAQKPAAPERDAWPDAYERRVLDTYLVDGVLTTIPAQRKKREIILRYLAEQFDPARVYTEQEVSQILARYHEDFATLRRELVMVGLLVRPGGQYRRTLPATDATAAHQ